MKPYIHRRAFFRGLVVAAALPMSVAMTAVLGRAADRERMTRLGDSLMCMCGCGQLLIRCNMTNCPKSVPMVKELAEHIDAGEMDPQIISFFVEKYGTSVLAGGGAQGKLAGVIVYIAVALGALAAVFVVRRWKATSVPVVAGSETPGTGMPDPLDQEYRRRAEEDLKKLNPED